MPPRVIKSFMCSERIRGRSSGFVRTTRSLVRREAGKKAHSSHSRRGPRPSPRLSVRLSYYLQCAAAAAEGLRCWLANSSARVGVWVDKSSEPMRPSRYIAECRPRGGRGSYSYTMTYIWLTMIPMLTILIELTVTHMTRYDSQATGILVSYYPLVQSIF